MHLKIKSLFLGLLVFLLGSLQAEQDWAPDFLIIGAQKSGTTVLYEFLNSHPMVVKKLDEVHFFDRNFEKGVEWYKNQFAPRPDPSYILGDKSPYYLFHPLAAQRAYALYPNVKIIVILRNPVDRAYSQYWMNVRGNVEPLSFKEAVQAEPSRLAGEKEKILADPLYKSYNYPKFSYLARGIYVDQLKEWFSYYPREQFLILSSDDLRKDPRQVMSEVYAFLGLPDYINNAWDNNRKSEYPPMGAGLRLKLKEHFKPYNQQLEELLERKFNWD